MALKLSNKTKRMAILKPIGPKVTTPELLITRSKGDGTTIGMRVGYSILGKPIWRTYSVEELLLGISYVTMPQIEFKEMMEAEAQKLSGISGVS